jgi:hypothetical protein
VTKLAFIALVVAVALLGAPRITSAAADGGAQLAGVVDVEDSLEHLGS